MLLVALAASLAVAAPGAAPSTAAPKKCGDVIVEIGAGADRIRAEGVSCRTARRIARTYYKDHEVEGWRCRERRLDLEYWKVRCTRSDDIVRFGYGA